MLNVAAKRKKEKGRSRSPRRKHEGTRERERFNKMSVKTVKKISDLKKLAEIIEKTMEEHKKNGEWIYEAENIDRFQKFKKLVLNLESEIGAVKDVEILKEKVEIFSELHADLSDGTWEVDPITDMIKSERYFPTEEELKEWGFQ